MEAQRPKETLEGLLYPVVILDRHWNICFMNGAARRLLPKWPDLRLAAYVRSKVAHGADHPGPSKLQNGDDPSLKVGLAKIEWLGEKGDAGLALERDLVPGHDPGSTCRKSCSRRSSRRTNSPRTARRWPGFSRSLRASPPPPTPGPWQKTPVACARTWTALRRKTSGCNRTSPGPRASTRELKEALAALAEQARAADRGRNHAAQTGAGRPREGPAAVAASEQAQSMLGQELRAPRRSEQGPHGPADEQSRRSRHSAKRTTLGADLADRAPRERD